MHRVQKYVSLLMRNENQKNWPHIRTNGAPAIPRRLRYCSRSLGGSLLKMSEILLPQFIQVWQLVKKAESK